MRTIAMLLPLALLCGQTNAQERFCDTSAQTGVRASASESVVADAYLQAKATSDALLAPRADRCEILADNKPKSSGKSKPVSKPAPADVPKYGEGSYRFDMQQKGKRMSAEDFDEWMKAKGVRVATGVPTKAK